MGIALGIDLGTTNTVVARVDVADPAGAVEDVDVAQLVAAGEVAALPQLASAVYLPVDGELDDEARRLPWGESPAFPVGALARDKGAKVPGRVIVSAKSWLSTSTVDRRAAILPWAADDPALPRLSPVSVQARLLAHVRQAVAYAAHTAGAGGGVIDDVTVTIPASFDEVARTLTLEAAAEAGFANARLLEEPQAAFYALLHKNSHRLKELLHGRRVVLVVDVGGGTSDFTLLTLDDVDGKAPPRVERIAVGDHLMLGGDNMDVTLARHVEQKLTGAVGALDAVSFAQLVLSARLAKETLLSVDAGAADDDAEVGVTLLSRGKKLLAGAKTHALSRKVVRELVLDGFFPVVGGGDVVDTKRGALAELGLPYAREPALPKHIVTFLRRHKDAAIAAGARVNDGLPLPDAVLLNGGVFRSPAIRARLAAQFARWAGVDVPFFDVDGADLDRAVARGAAYAALVRRGRGVRIGAGNARAYFVGVDGDDARRQALCVAPRGLHEGEGVTVARTFKVVTGAPVSFPLFSSTFSTAKVGDVVDAADLEALPSLSTVLQPAREVPVRLEASLSEVGTLELALKMTDEALQKFSLSFNTRLDGVVNVDAPAAGKGTAGLPAGGPAHKRVDEGKDLILGFFGNKSKDVDPKKVKDLRRDLEKLFGVREQWSLALLRELGGTLLTGASRRRRTAEHERAFFQLLGWCLRPGSGAPFDDWRIEQVWPLWREGVQYIGEKPTWASWFVLWRRVAGGLDAARQREVWDYLKPWLLEQGTGKKGVGANPAGQDEMIRLACSLERIPAVEKAELGEFVMKKMGRGGLLSAWPLGRLGARVPLAGSAHDVVDAAVAARFIDKILEQDVKAFDGALFALATIARMSGDRARDVDADVRAKVIARLEKAGAPAALIAGVKDVVARSADDEAAAFGDALPIGLRLG